MRRRNRSFFALCSLLFAIALLLALAACGDDDGPTPDTGPTADSAQATDSTTSGADTLANTSQYWPEEWDTAKLEPPAGQELFVGDSFEVGGDVPTMFDDNENELDVSFSITLTGNGIKHEIVTGTVKAGASHTKCYVWDSTMDAKHEDGAMAPMSAGSYTVVYRAFNPADPTKERISQQAMELKPAP